MTTSERWDALQARFAAGEPLGAEEERERREGAAGDPLAERELALFDELHARGEGTSELPRGLVERVLEAVGARPRLHLLAPGELPPAAPRAGGRRRAVVLASAAIALSAAGVVLAVALLRPERTPASAAVTAPTSAPRFARAELVLASGEVTAPGGSRVGEKPLATGDRLSTGDGRACLGVDPGIDVCLGGNSEIYLESLRAESVRIRVERGTALAALTRREPGHEFSLTTESVEVTAHGTVFAVERSGERIDVVVMEGAVEVASPSAPPALVAAHSRFALRDGARREPEAIGRGEEARFWALLAARELWAKPELGVLEIGAESPGLELTIDRGAPMTLPFRAFVPSGRRTLGLRSASGSESTTTVDVVAGETLVLDPRELGTKHQALEEPAVAPSPASLLARARKELAAGNARAALALYENLRAAHPTSREARTVLVTIGKLELDLKQPARALRSFDAYLAAPGPLGPEALAGKIRALRALGRTAEEKRAIETYLSRHADGFEAPLLAQRLQVLQGR